MNYCTIEDLETTWRSLSDIEKERAEKLIVQISAELRVIADRHGVNLDEKVQNNEDYGLVVKSVTIDTISRVLNQNTSAEPLSQFSQAAGGYSISGTYLTAGGGTLILNRDLKRLGFKRQRLGVVDIWHS